MFSDADKALIEQGAKALMDAAGKAAELGIKGVMAEAYAGLACSTVMLAVGATMTHKGIKLSDDYSNEGLAFGLTFVGCILTAVGLVGFLCMFYNTIMVLMAPEWVLMKTVLGAVRGR